ncbi:TPA: hypothetical protein DCF80_03400 [Candidatus Saccharibacteria bacterium]|mgnify:CR=1 FL=1|nr:hypothetical protein [Candidatus Saccharibacteria bacterium]HRK40597.1 hypothetical protein [Candidatus Saccharibacteria bacterium]
MRPSDADQLGVDQRAQRLGQVLAGLSLDPVALGLHLAAVAADRVLLLEAVERVLGAAPVLAELLEQLVAEVVADPAEGDGDHRETLAVHHQVGPPELGVHREHGLEEHPLVVVDSAGERSTDRGDLPLAALSEDGLLVGVVAVLAGPVLGAAGLLGVASDLILLVGGRDVLAGTLGGHVVPLSGR